MPRGQYQRKEKTVAVIGGTSETTHTSQAVETHEPKPVVAPVKKGRRSWGRSDVLGVVKKDQNFTYKWVRKEAMNIARHLEQGWEYDGKVVNAKAVHTPTETMYDGADLTSTKETRDSILMRLPKELKAERDEWLDSENRRSEAALKADKDRQEFNKDLKGSIDIKGGSFNTIID